VRVVCRGKMVQRHTLQQQYPTSLLLPWTPQVANGSLFMFARAASWPNTSFPPGYGNFTTSAVHSIDRTAHGMFEIKSRSGSSSISSSFWFHQNDGNGTWTEIDVFESMGATNPDTKFNMNSSLYCSHTHIFSLQGVNSSGANACRLLGSKVLRS